MFILDREFITIKNVILLVQKQVFAKKKSEVLIGVSNKISFSIMYKNTVHLFVDFLFDEVDT